MRKFYGITPEELPNNLQTFDATLKKTFGSSFRTLEKAAVKRLCFNLGIEFTERPGYRFTDYVQLARIVYARPHGRRTS
jgi:hypothetical protein